jgi:hypothetical protein
MDMKNTVTRNEITLSEKIANTKWI